MHNLDKKHAKLIQDRWHKVLYVLSVLFTLIFFVVGIVLIVMLLSGGIRFSFISDKSHHLLAFALIVVIILPLVVFINRMLAIVKPVCDGIKVTDNIFPEINEIVKTYADILSINIPSVYIAGGSRKKGSSHCFKKWQIVILHTDLIEAKGNFSDYNVLKFELARQMGLLALGERDFSVEFLSMVPSSLPYISNLISRAEEYTADRIACLLAADSAAMYFSFCAIGKGLWSKIRIKSLLQQAGKAGIVESIYSCFMSMPPLPWRVLAMAKIGVFNSDNIEKWKRAKTLDEKFKCLDYTKAAPFLARPRLISNEVLETCDNRCNRDILNNN